MQRLIVSYLRVSTANQRDEQTIETQRYTLDRYCELYGIKVDKRFEDDGVSGGVEIHKRPSGADLYRLISSGCVDRLLLFHADRIGRDTIDSLLFHRLAESHGTIILGVADGTNTANEGSVFTTEMRAVVAAEMRRDCTRRTKAGLRRRASEGRISTKPPYGYQVKDGKLVIDEIRAEIVAQMFARLIRGERTRDIVLWLNESNAPSPRGKGWRHDTLIYMLKSNVYEGKFIAFRTPKRRPGGGRRLPRDPKDQVTIPCPAIVTPEVFQAAQERIGFNRVWCSTSQKRFYLLKSLVRCGKCGRSFVGHAIVGRRYKTSVYPDVVYYECGSQSNRDIEFCGNVRVNASRLESVVWSHIESFITAPSKLLERLAARYNRQAASSSSASERRVNRIEALRKKNREARDRLTLAVARGVITDDDARRAAETLARELSDLDREFIETRQAQGESESRRRQILDAQAMLAMLRDGLTNGYSPQKKAEITRRLVRQAIVTISDNGRAQIDVQYMFPSALSFGDVGLASPDTTTQQLMESTPLSVTERVIC